MRDYRIYFMNADGHIVRAEDVECGVDQVAMRLAWSLRAPHGVEVWQGTRLVGRVAAQPRPTPVASVLREPSRWRRLFGASPAQA